MRFSLRIAIRYLFSKKTHNSINITSMICAGGICVATIALVCTLSVYNGFQSLISGLYNALDPDLKVVLVEGKTFTCPQTRLDSIKSIPQVAAVAEVLEENAMIKYKENQSTVFVKGVSDNYKQLIQTDSVLTSGQFILRDGENDFTVIGAATASVIEANTACISPLHLYAPKHNTKVNIANPEKSFNDQLAYVSGIYAVNQQDIDSRFAFCTLDYARNLFNYTNQEISSLEINVEKNADEESIKNQISNILGDNFIVKDKHEQHEEFYRMLKVEKWITFLILFFILMIAVVNVIGSLTMLIIEKENDIRTLSSLGANNQTIKEIFIFEGWLISVTGAIVGVIIGLALCLLQQQFGLLKLNSGSVNDAFIVDSYPVVVNASDISIILITILLVGLLIAWFPSRYVGKEGK
ncbi:MAG: FtsX-like permease family protein [Paludibacteraceae bacterium]|nr:FtsX-like permease family protein [Paludibacteraceae bacterium]